MSYSRQIVALLCWCLIGLASLLPSRIAAAALVVTDVNMRADQNVSLLGVDASLSATGMVHWVFDVDANGDSIPAGASTVDAVFQGTLPAEFGGLAGAAYDLFSIDGQETVTTSNNGTHVRALTNFGLKVYAAPNVVLAEFYTQTPSIFEADVIGLANFNGSVFQDNLRPNDLTQVFIGQNGLSIIPNTLAGASFNRTVTAVPEPSSLVFATCGGVLGLLMRHRRRQRCE